MRAMENLEVLEIHCTVKDFEPIDPPRVRLLCRSEESAAQLQDALVNAGFDTDRPAFGTIVEVKQGDGTL